MVVEDAAAGVQAAKAGSMAAIGIARSDDEALLFAAGADIVVTSLDQIDRAALAEGQLATQHDLKRAQARFPRSSMTPSGRRSRRAWTGTRHSRPSTACTANAHIPTMTRPFDVKGNGLQA